MISKGLRLFLFSLAIILIGSLLVFFGNFILFDLIYVFVYLFIVLITFLKEDNRKRLIYIISIFTGIMVIELVFNHLVIFNPDNSDTVFLFSKIIGAIFVFIPFIIEPFIIVTKYDYYNFPSIVDPNAISYSDFLKFGSEISEGLEKLKEIKEKITYDDILKIMKDFPKHNSFKYINKNSLSPEYFKKAYDAIDDKNIYIILSNTGSAASEIISIFTKKAYNHV